MWFRTLTGVQRHRLTNALFVAGVVSALATVTGSNLLGCPAVSRDKHLDNEPAGNEPAKQKELQRLTERRFVAGKLEKVSDLEKRSE
ncbi:hypothetical protein EV183_000553 [Coemansia sp. RSA 2336]|nr:hypothetical protein EV183_000553 [Coemansia sp. RSA 2336]